MDARAMPYTELEECCKVRRAPGVRIGPATALLIEQTSVPHFGATAGIVATSVIQVDAAAK